MLPRAGGSFERFVRKLRKDVDGMRSLLHEELARIETERQRIVDRQREAMREGEVENGRTA